MDREGVGRPWRNEGATARRAAARRSSSSSDRGGVERMPRREQHGVLVLGALALLLAEGELAVAGLGATKALDRCQTVGAQRPRHVLDRARGRRLAARAACRAARRHGRRTARRTPASAAAPPSASRAPAPRRCRRAWWPERCRRSARTPCSCSGSRPSISSWPVSSRSGLSSASRSSRSKSTPSDARAPRRRRRRRARRGPSRISLELLAAGGAAACPRSCCSAQKLKIKHVESWPMRWMRPMRCSSRTGFQGRS